METDKFKKAKELSDEIEQKQHKLYFISRLLKSCSLDCKISGTPKNDFIRLGEYRTNNVVFIKKLLENDKLLLETKLNDLQKQFNEL